MLTLILALILVESSGDNNAIGDNGKAFGSLQIHQICIDDVNRIYKTNYSHQDAFDRQKSIRICELYLSHYATEKRLNRKVTDQDRARIWNAGPRGYKKENSKPYWKKVKKALDYNQTSARVKL